MPDKDLLKQLHDIEGLDLISYWPLAVGWWLLLAVGVTLIILGMFFYYKRRRYRASWLYPVYRDLLDLEQVVGKKSKKYIITELSEQIRKIAVQKYPREDCASLTGKKWLEWLTANDPKNFNWVEHGQVILLGPYAPELSDVSADELKKLITATTVWVR